MEDKKVSCTKEDIDALKLLFYFNQKTLERGKGLAYKQAFNFKKALIDLKKDLKNYNIDELLEVL